MSHYRRLLIPGGTYFFTVRLEDTASALLVQEIDLLRDAVRLCRKQRPFFIDCAVVLQSRIHMIWTLPDGDAAYSDRWRQIKSTFSRHVPPPPRLCRSKARRGEKGIWQRRFWEHAMRDGADLALHRAAILTAPVRAGLVARPGDWPHSSIHRDGADALANLPPDYLDRLSSVGWV